MAEELRSQSCKEESSTGSVERVDNSMVQADVDIAEDLDRQMAVQ